MISSHMPDAVRWVGGISTAGTCEVWGMAHRVMHARQSTSAWQPYIIHSDFWWTLYSEYLNISAALPTCMNPCSVHGWRLAAAPLRIRDVRCLRCTILSEAAVELCRRNAMDVTCKCHLFYITFWQSRILENRTVNSTLLPNKAATGRCTHSVRRSATAGPLLHQQSDSSTQTQHNVTLSSCFSATITHHI